MPDLLASNRVNECFFSTNLNLHDITYRSNAWSIFSLHLTLHKKEVQKVNQYFLSV